jgi:hypothetical protein
MGTHYTVWCLKWKYFVWPRRRTSRWGHFYWTSGHVHQIGTAPALSITGAVIPMRQVKGATMTGARINTPSDLPFPCALEGDRFTFFGDLCSLWN